jgi:hypothetical protein
MSVPTSSSAGDRDGQNHHSIQDQHHDHEGKKKKKGKAATGASAASIRAISSQVVAFYFRAPVKAFFRSRVEYVTSFLFYS